MEAELGLPTGFLEGIKKEDDWSFIIKTHALLEAAVSHLLCKALGKDALADVFSHLELSDKRRGKVAFATALDLLQKPDRRFISSLSELRNSLVHDVRNVGFSLPEHVAAMDATAFAEFVKRFDSFSIGGTVAFEGKEVPSGEVFRRDPKTAIWWSAMLTVAIIYQVKEIHRLRAEIDHQQAEMVKTLTRPVNLGTE
jgi:hypothetical protein